MARWACRRATKSSIACRRDCTVCTARHGTTREYHYIVVHTSSSVLRFSATDDSMPIVVPDQNQESSDGEYIGLRFKERFVLTTVFVRLVVVCLCSLGCVRLKLFCTYLLLLLRWPHSPFDCVNLTWLSVPASHVCLRLCTAPHRKHFTIY